MAIKDLAVAYDASDNADVALSFAVQMARKYDASLTGIYAVSAPKVEHRVERWMSKDMMDALRQGGRSLAEAVKKTFRERVEALGHGGPVAWVEEEGSANQVLARKARYHDIMILGQYTNPETARGELRAENLAMRLGRPLIVVPTGYEVRPFEEFAVVAWDGSRAATRALSDAMQILETKRRIDVLTIVVRGEPYDQGELAEMVQHLERHGVTAQPISVPSHRGGIGTTILDYCRETKPDVLVMGAYGHSKLREDLFGGTTRRVLHQTRVPVLMAH